MTHNSLIRPSGWSAGSTVLATEFATIDQNVAASINGDAGGTWSPTSLITIGGNYGLTVAGPFATSGTTALGDTSADTLTVAATTTFNSAVTIASAATENHNGTCYFNSNEYHVGYESHTGAEQHSGNENHNGSCYFYSNMLLGDASTNNINYTSSTKALNITATTLAVTGNTTVTGDATFSGSVVAGGNTTIGSGPTLIQYSHTYNTLSVVATSLAVSGGASFASGISASGSSPVWSIASDGSLACKTVKASGNVTTAGTITSTATGQNTLSGFLAVNNDLYVSGQLTANGLLYVTGNGGVIKGDITRTQTTIMNLSSDVTISPQNFVRVSVALNNTALILNDAATPGGMMVIITIDSSVVQTSGTNLLVKSMSRGSTIATMTIGSITSPSKVLGLIRNTNNLTYGWDIAIWI